MMPRWVLLPLLLVGCGTSEPRPPAQPWPAADAAMQRPLIWRGGDAAYSAPLDDGRVLWLFGDSFVGEGDGTPGRGGRAMLRNTVAIASGPDPSTASFDARGRDDGPFFPHPDPLWLWPGPATNLGDGLLLTFVRVRESTEGLGFQTVDSRAFRVRDTDGEPEDWALDPVTLPPAPPGVQLGLGAHLLHKTDLYAFAPVEPGSHDVYLARWSQADVVAGDLGRPQWWSGAGWEPSAGRARPVVHRLQTEFSVSEVGDALWMVSTEGFGATDIVVRTASAPEGPWSAPRTLFRPPEHGRDDVLVYSAKVQPHLKGAPVVLTYCTNRTDFWDLVGDLGVYFPRFVRVTP